MEKEKSKKWRTCLSAAAITAAAVLLFFLYPKFDSARTWATDVLYAGAEPEITIETGHGPLARPDAQAPDDLSVRLHPDRHIRRAAQAIELEWNVTNDWRWPDGVAKEVYLINGEFPGPTIEVRSGDELSVTVHNQLEGEEIWIHWHGLRFENQAEEVLGLTRCAIAANASYTYRLQVSPEVHGTFWYYSQAEMQRGDGLFGTLVVHEPRKDLDEDSRPPPDLNIQEDQLLLINDWYHQPSSDVLAAYRDGEFFDAAPPPDSILLNGRGYFDCSKAYDEPSMDCKPMDMPHLTFPDRARLRIVNAGSLVGLTISTVGYSMTVLAVDGGTLVERATFEKLGVLYPGQRMDILFERRGDDQYDSAWITIALDRETMQYPNLVLTDTQQFHIATSRVTNKDALERGGPEIDSGKTNNPFLDLSNVKAMVASTSELGKKADNLVA
ncbi:Laccase-1 [Fulvia fulva]|uniref:Laccase-1 n=1 Tax=Passalora fulva TaxID=5499 RepID=A0A9Q8L787_PASFU|nr:Laccase-1 [Fulvia fulva]KAK4636222.1 Laccase-1 [Fulvia fulva]UJO12100.1 Laccase-1 [Fulvia fulva]WPV08471.1 Laccase-1 [Fulvia fulva]WPV24362.1 Laccase-1 [Fulvia fulva]